MKKLLTIMICALSMICLTVHAEPTVTTTGEAKEPIKVYIFTKDHCPFCEKAETYIKGLEADYGDYFDLVIYQVYDINFQIENKQYYNLMNTVAKLFKTEVSGVPYIVIGDEYDQKASIVTWITSSGILDEVTPGFMTHLISLESSIRISGSPG